MIRRHARTRRRSGASLAHLVGLAWIATSIAYLVVST